MSEAVEQWNRAAEAWAKWRHVFEQRTDPEDYIREAGLKPGWRVLDAGAGTGLQTIPIARAVSPGGHVVATDIAAPMLEHLQAAARAVGLDNVDTVVSDSAELDLDGPPFDAAIASFMLMLAPDPVRVAERVRAHLKPGAPFVASVWSTPEKAPMLSTAMVVAVMQFGLQPPDPDGPGVFSLGKPDRLREVLEAAGFTDVAVKTLPAVMRYASADEYVAMTRDVTVVVGELIRDQLPDQEDAVWEAVRTTVAEQAADDGSVTFENEALVVVGTNPV